MSESPARNVSRAERAQPTLAPHRASQSEHADRDRVSATGARTLIAGITASQPAPPRSEPGPTSARVTGLCLAIL